MLRHQVDDDLRAVLWQELRYLRLREAVVGQTAHSADATQFQDHVIGSQTGERLSRHLARQLPVTSLRLPPVTIKACDAFEATQCATSSPLVTMVRFERAARQRVTSIVSLLGLVKTVSPSVTIAAAAWPIRAS
jgi:hypothetical protein